MNRRLKTCATAITTPQANVTDRRRLTTRPEYERTHQAASWRDARGVGLRLRNRSLLEEIGEPGEDVGDEQDPHGGQRIDVAGRSVHGVGGMTSLEVLAEAGPQWVAGRDPVGSGSVVETFGPQERVPSGLPSRSRAASSYWWVTRWTVTPASLRARITSPPTEAASRALVEPNDSLQISSDPA
jgi:hypothetical protein